MMDDGQLSLRTILEEIHKSKNELVQAIEASETRLRFEVEGQSNKIRQLTKENSELKKKIERLEINNRKNNIILFGLNKSFHDISTQLLADELKKVLGVVIQESDFNNFQCLGSGPNPPIKIELTTYLKKVNILKNCYKLKGTSLSISHDLTESQREDNKILRYFLKKEKETGKYKKCFIRGSKLILDNNEFTANELHETEEEDQKKIVSAPSTPTQRARGEGNDSRERRNTKLAGSKDKIIATGSSTVIETNESETENTPVFRPNNSVVKTKTVLTKQNNSKSRVLRSVSSSSQSSSQKVDTKK